MNKLDQPDHDLCCRGPYDSRLDKLLDGLATSMGRMKWDPDLGMFMFLRHLDKNDADAWWIALQFRAETLKTGRRPDNWHPNG